MKKDILNSAAERKAHNQIGLTKKKKKNAIISVTSLMQEKSIANQTMKTYLLLDKESHQSMCMTASLNILTTTDTVRKKRAIT